MRQLAHGSTPFERTSSFVPTPLIANGMGLQAARKRRKKRPEIASMRLLVSLLIVISVLSSHITAEAAWLLWEHWVEHRYPLPEQKDEKGMTKGFRKISDTWSLHDALDARAHCVVRLKERLARIREVTEWSEQDIKASERTQFKDLPQDKMQEITREMVMFQNIQKPDGNAERSFSSIKVWCLPVGVDPKTIGDR